jgi:hypothetical protein
MISQAHKPGDEPILALLEGKILEHLTVDEPIGGCAFTRPLNMDRFAFRAAST